MEYTICNHCGRKIAGITRNCPFCNTPNEQNKELDKVCKNCNSLWREGDRYCRYCGAPMDQPGYRIRMFSCIYGPMPVIREHKCPNCNYTWRTKLMVDEEKYCPRCGTAVSTDTPEEELW